MLCLMYKHLNHNISIMILKGSIQNLYLFAYYIQGAQTIFSKQDIYKILDKGTLINYFKN